MPASTLPTAATRPGPAALRSELMRAAPFAQMDAAHVDRFIAASTLQHHAAGEVLLSPDSGVVKHLYCVRQGSVTGRRGVADAAGGFQFEPGDLFPMGAVVGARPVTATYTANENTQCLLLPVAQVQALAAESAPFADFLHRGVLKLLELSQRALQATYSMQAGSEQSLDTPLGHIARKQPAAVGADAPLSQALALMHERHVGSVLVLDAAGAAVGILTRHDIVGRVALPQVPLAAPIAQVMSAPVHSLAVDATGQDAALLMSRHGIRHVPVTEGGRVVGIVSERDLFALQRLSLRQVSTAIRGAQDVAGLAVAAQEIRRFARSLVGQGVGARRLTELISHLNDVLTERLVHLLATDAGMDLTRACWLAFGSEGRNEQTIATDQDNGLVFDSDDPQRDRPAWLAFARRVNDALDACGYPLCKGNVMASNPDCCLTADEWCARFAQWIDHGAPQDLLNASIYFDFRPLVGRTELAAPLRELLLGRAPQVPRFMQQMALNALNNRPPLNWLGGIDTQQVGEREVIDLKMHGTVIFVDAARLYALARGIGETGTRQRFEAVARVWQTEPRESEAWIGGFEFLQMLRLRVQMERTGVPSGEGNPNLLPLDALNEIDRRVLKECLRVGRRLQQRMELDYRR